MTTKSVPEQRHEDQNERQRRYISHALVEVRRFKSLPFFCHSAVLLDMSPGGFKLEFTSDIRVHPGSKSWLSIPLSPLGILDPKLLICQYECRWFDEGRYRMGGIFINLKESDQALLGQIIAGLKERGHL
jgi:hypothetical protein